MKLYNRYIKVARLILLLVPVLASAPCLGGATLSKQLCIRIGGTVDHQLDAHVLTITLATDVFQTINWSFDAEQISIPITNGAFSGTFNLPHRFCYAKFQLLGKGTGKLVNSALTPLAGYFILLESGNDIELEIFTDSLSFSGDGANLFRCQYDALSLRDKIVRENIFKLRQLEQGMQKSMVEHIDTHAMHLYVTFRAEQESRIRDEQIALLRRSRDRLSQIAVEILTADYRAGYISSVLQQLHFLIRSSKFSNIQGAQRDIVQFFLDSMWFADNPSINTKVITLSQSYLPAVYLKELSAFSLPLKANGTTVDGAAIFEAVVRRITDTYDGVLVEQLLTTAFATQISFGNISDDLFEYAIGFIKSDSYRQRMYELHNTVRIGMTGFDFSLPDSTGSLLSFSSLKGKVVFLDFWYTGCGGCIGLKKKLAPVVQQFADNREVAFVTISIDKDFSIWKKSLRSGVYTHGMSIDLYTGGKGKNAPVIHHYRIGAYPTIIVFDREGKIQAFNPPGIGGEVGNNRLIALIEKLL